MGEMAKSLFMAFTFLFAMYYSMVGITHIISGALRVSLLAVFTEQKDKIYINIFPATLGIIGWTVFAAEKGVFNI